MFCGSAFDRQLQDGPESIIIDRPISSIGELSVESGCSCAVGAMSLFRRVIRTEKILLPEMTNRRKPSFGGRSPMDAFVAGVIRLIPSIPRILNPSTNSQIDFLVVQAIAVNVIDLQLVAWRQAHNAPVDRLAKLPIIDLPTTNSVSASIDRPTPLPQIKQVFSINKYFFAFVGIQDCHFASLKAARIGRYGTARATRASDAS
jgi:hypothetical protein